jgi:hypothetical protein
MCIRPGSASVALWVVVFGGTLRAELELEFLALSASRLNSLLR